MISCHSAICHYFLFKYSDIGAKIPKKKSITEAILLKKKQKKTSKYDWVCPRNAICCHVTDLNPVLQ